MRPRWDRRSRARYRRSVAIAAALHLAALGTLWALPIERPRQPARFAGEPLVVAAALAAHAPPLENLATTFEPPAEPVLIEPRRATIAEHVYVQTPGVEVELNELVPDELLQETDLAELPPAVQRTSVDSSDMPPDTTEPTASTVVAKTPLERSVVPESVQAEGPSATAVATQGNDTPADFSGNRPPHYPELALQRRWEGQVLLRMFVTAEGRVRHVEVVRSSGYQLLDAAAASAVRTWRGSPAIRGGAAVESVELLPVRFQLR